MDKWLYYDVTHALHRYCNPISRKAVREMSDLLELHAGSRVLDIASGMGEMLIEFHERYGATGVGVDLSPYALRRAEGRKSRRAPDADISFLEVDGAEYVPEDGERFDVVMCIGASWIWKGFEGTLDALIDLANPGGLVVSAEPFWISEPPAENLDPEEQEFFSLAGCYEIALDNGLRLVWMRESSRQEWDRYEMLQMASFDRFERAQPDHPDLAEIRERLRGSKEAYFRWEREYFGFAFWLFRTPEDGD